MTEYGSFSDGYENTILDHVLQGGASPLAPPADIYVGLSKADPLEDGSGLNEPSGGGYSRVLWNSWNTPVNRGISNYGSIVFPKAAAGWDTVTHWFLADAASGGNIIAQGPLAAAKTVNTDNVFALASGEAEIHFRRWKLFFYSGGTYEIQVGDIIEGVVSGASAEVLSVDLYGGSWAGGDAEGFFRIRKISGTFNPGGEILAVGAESDAAYTDSELAGGISNYLAHKMLDLIFNGIGYTGPDSYLGLSNGNPGDDGAGIVEPEGANYARLLVDNWTTAMEGASINSDTVTMNTPSGSWGIVDHAFLADALTEGNLLFYTRLRIANNPNDGDSVRFMGGDLEVRIDTPAPATTTTTTTTAP